MRCYGESMGLSSFMWLARDILEKFKSQNPSREEEKPPGLRARPGQEMCCFQEAERAERERKT